MRIDTFPSPHHHHHHHRRDHYIIVIICAYLFKYIFIYKQPRLIDCARFACRIVGGSRCALFAIDSLEINREEDENGIANQLHSFHFSFH